MSNKADVHTESGFNLERALDTHLPAELRAAERVVRDLEVKIDAARERLYKLRAIATSAGLKSKPEEAPITEDTPSVP